MKTVLNQEKKRAVFTEKETHILIQLWADKKIQTQFRNNLRHNEIYELLSSQLKNLGFDKTPPEIRSKINNLKHIYKTMKTTSAEQTWPFYKAMHAVLCQTNLMTDNLLEDSLQHFIKAETNNHENLLTKEQLQGNKHKHIENRTAIEEHVDSSRNSLLSRSLNNSEKEGVNQRGKKRVAFTTNETHVLIQIWGEQNMQNKFRNSLRHHEIYELLSSRLKDLGFDKTATEIKYKINNLKYIYKTLKSSSGTAEPTWPFYKAMNAVLSQRDLVCISTEDSLPQFIKEEMNNYANFHSEITNDSRKDNRKLTEDILSVDEETYNRRRSSLTESPYNSDSESVILVASPEQRQGSNQKEKKRVTFTTREIHALIQLWADKNVQKKFRSTLRHNELYKLLSTQLKDLGFDKTPSEIKSKINNLKHIYKTMKLTAGSVEPTWPFYKAMHSVLSQRDLSNDDLVEDSLPYFVEVEMDNGDNYLTESEEETAENENKQIEGRISLEETADTSKNSSLIRNQNICENNLFSAEQMQDAFDTTGTSNLILDISDNDNILTEAESNSFNEPSKKRRRVSRSAQRKKLDSTEKFIHTLLSIEQRQNKLLQRQTKQLELLVKQEQENKRRDDRVAESLIKYLDVATQSLSVKRMK